MNKYSIILMISFSIISLTIFSSNEKVWSLDLNFGGENGFTFEIDELPSISSQGPPGPQGEQGPPGSGGIQTGTLIVKVQIHSTIADEVEASDILIVVNGNNPIPSEFQGSENGTNVIIEEGDYFVTVTPPDGVAENTSINQCDDTMFSGQIKNCTVLVF